MTVHISYIQDHWRSTAIGCQNVKPIISILASVSRIKFEINIMPISVASYVATHAVAFSS